MVMTTTAERDEAAIAWLVHSAEPGIALQSRRDLRGELVEVDSKLVMRGAAARTLVEGQQSDGGFGGHPYAKWTGAHWRLLTLIDLGLSGRDRRAQAAVDPVLDWLLGDAHMAGIKTISGRTRRCASQE